MIREQQFVSVVTDGWTDPNGSSIINFMAVAPGMPSLFWSSWSTHSKQHTSDYIGGEIERVIADIEQTTNALVVGVVTDNANNMARAWSDIQDRRSNVIGGGCAAHVLNLLMRDVCQHKAILGVHTRALAVTRFVRDHLALLDEFKTLLESVRAQGQRGRNFATPVSTRWYSVHACLRSVLGARDILEELFLAPHYEDFRSHYKTTAANRKKLQYITSLMNDSVFWENLRVVIRYIDPIIEALRELESDSTFVSGVYKHFQILKLHPLYVVPHNSTLDSQAPVQESTASSAASALQALQRGECAPTMQASQPEMDYQVMSPIPTQELQGFFRQKILARWEYVRTNAMGIAFYFDPRVQLNEFDKGDDHKAQEDTCRLAEKMGLLKEEGSLQELWRELFAFASHKTRNGATMADMLSKVCPIQYWESMSASYPIMGAIANVIWALPTSSAASERAWSIFDHVHSKKRNRLSVEKVEKLVFVYINSGTVGGERSDFARVQSSPDRDEIDAE